MKNRGYIVLIVALLFVCGYLGYKNINRTEYIHQSEKIVETPESWYKPIVKSANSKPISVIVNGIKTFSKDYPVIMDENMELFLPMEILSDTFDCAVYQFNDDNVTIEQNDKKISMAVGEDSMLINGIQIKLQESLIKNKEMIYVPISAVSTGLKYDYHWNSMENSVIIIDDNSMPTLPYSYDYRKSGRNSVVKDQGRFGTCWAFAALTAMETSLMPKNKYDFAIEHMVLANNYDTNMKDGGDYAMSMAYLTSWKGPVLTADDKYGDKKTDESLDEVVHVQEIQIIESKDYATIKEMVYKYGGVQSSLYTNLTGASSSSKYYNKKKMAYCYIGTEKPNHDVVIIGWDDNYPKENFVNQPENNGAFICQNSWGEDFGDGGIFYVSYYDTNIGMHNIVYTGIEATDNYDNIYQADLCGVVGHMGYGRETAYFANVYQAKNNENIVAASFHTTGKNTQYAVYVVDDFKSTEDFDKKILVAEGIIEQKGYYTIDFDKVVGVAKDKKYAIVVKVTTPNSTKPIAVEYQTNSLRAEVNIEDGEGYISWSGKNWENTEKTHNCNICLKAFTNDIA